MAVFDRIVTASAFTTLALLAAITAFLGFQAIPVLVEQGPSFLTTSTWQDGQYGIWGMLYGSVLLALIALVVAAPISVLLAVFIVFLAPRVLARAMTTLIDLMAAIPSVIIGLWAFHVLQPAAEPAQRALADYLGWIPLFTNTSGNFTGTPFTAGLVLAIMMVPIVTSVAREVLARTPADLVAAADALGCSLATKLRFVALPYGRGGIIGGVMLGLGRALGETIAVFFVLKVVFDPVNYLQILESGGGSVATLIVSKFGEASGPQETQALLAAGFFLFAGTVLVNAVANLIVNRTTRSHA